MSDKFQRIRTSYLTHDVVFAVDMLEADVLPT